MKKISTLFVLMFLVINLLGQNAKEPELLKFLAPVFQSRGADKSLSGASVLYFTDGTLGTDQMLVSLESYGSSITLSVVTTSAAFADSIITHSYDIAILLVQNYQASNYTDGINALINFINEGGIGMYSDWSLNSTFATQLGFSFTGNTNNTIVTVLPPMSDDLDENPIILTNPGWGVFSTGLATTDGIVHATFSNGDAAILETMDGHAFIYGFTNDATALPDIFTTGNEYASGGLYPSDITLCSLDESGQFEAVMDSAETFQWSISIDGGSTYEELSDDETYTGSATSVLTINQITEDMLDYLYVCVGYWGEGQSDTSRIAGILFETESPEWALEDVYTLYTCESDTVVLTLPLPTDNCGIDSIYHDSEFGVSPTDPSGEYPLGTTTVNYYVEDVNGNSIAGSFVVEVLPDNVPPSWGIEGDVFASYTSTTAGGTTWSVASGGVLSGHPYSGGTCCSGYDPPFDVMTFTPATTGTYTITSTYSGFDGYLLLYTDPHSLAVNPPVTFVAGDDDYTSTSNAQITPTLNAGQNYYMYNTGYGTGSGSFTTNFSPAVMQANVIYGEACADSLWVDFSQPGDNCGLDSIAHDSPYGISDTDPSGYYPTGVTVVNYYLRDIYGNISEGIFSVNVVTDETSPVWAVGDTVLYTCADSAELTLPLPEDECGIDSIWHDSPYGISGTDPGGWYPMGTTTVNLYVEDNHGNIYTGSINVTVETEVEAPAWDIKDTTITACGETGNIILPEPEDNCGIDSLWHDSPSGSPDDPSGDYPLGSTLIHFELYDVNGNVLVDSFTITVIEDVINPEISCSDATVDIYSGQETYTVEGNEFDPAVTDNCEAELMNDFNSAASLDGAELPIGTTAIGWSATDLNGNSANCSQTITVNYIESYQHVTDNGKVELFPNPTAGEITIILQENSELFVMSITGKMVMRETLSPGEHIFDLKDNGKGLYLLRILGESYTFTDKIIIE